MHIALQHTTTLNIVIEGKCQKEKEQKEKRKLSKWGVIMAQELWREVVWEGCDVIIQVHESI